MSQSDQWISIAVLLALFVIATIRPINLGALAFVAALGVGVIVSGQDVKAIFAYFPGDIFVLLLGVTYLFGIATVNGTIERVVDWLAGLLRGNRVLLPWLIFVIAAVPTTAGAAGPAGIALLAPIAMRIARRYSIPPLLAALMVINGSDAGNFSPLNVLGVIVNGTVERNHLGANETTLWLANLAFNVILGLITFAFFGGRQLLREARAALRTNGEGDAPASGSTDSGGISGGRGTDRGSGAAATATISAPVATTGPTPVVLISTLLSIVAVAVGALAFDLDIGSLALTAAVGLHLMFPKSSARALERVSWSTIVLICGVVTYVALMQDIGTVTMIGDRVSDISTPLLAAFMLCLIAAVTSAFASSIGILGALIPLSVPLLAGGGLPVTGVIIGIAVSATVVDATPFSSVGALTIASAAEADRESLSKALIKWGFSMAVVAPVLCWLLFIAPW